MEGEDSEEECGDSSSGWETVGSDDSMWERGSTDESGGDSEAD